MDFDVWTFILDNLEAAGAIGGYVSISIIGFSLITRASSGKMKGEGQIGPKWAQPLIGAFLGVVPGCGATIVASSMYKNNKLSYGGLFAAFITTLGEGSFVLLGASDEADVAANLTAFAVVNAIGFVMGALFGYILDSLKLELNKDLLPDALEEEEREHSESVNHFAHGVIEGPGFYLIMAIAIFLAPGSIMALWGGGIDAIADLSVWVAIAFTIISIIYFFMHKFLYKGHDCAPKDSVKETLLHSVFDITMVILFVFIGLVVANYIIDILVGPEAFDAWMTQSAVLVVLISALIGATPGCGGMIAVAVAFISIPNFPMAALIAAALATSGDGIFPLLAQNKKDAVLITASGLAVSLVVGYLALAFGL